MYISVLDLFKIGIGPSSSHTIGPMLAANDFICRVAAYIGELPKADASGFTLRCILKGSLSYTGKGHATDHAIMLGMHGYMPSSLASQDVASLVATLWQATAINVDEAIAIQFIPEKHIEFDRGSPLPQHPNGMVFELVDSATNIVLTQTYFSIGGGFINTLEEIDSLVAPLKMELTDSCSYPFNSAKSMLRMAQESNLSIAQLKRVNELDHMTDSELQEGLQAVWQAMCTCVENGLRGEGNLPGGLNIKRRAKHVLQQLQNNPQKYSVNDWLSAYAMAVNEENAAGHMVVTAPTNGAAGVIPAVLYYFVQHEQGTQQNIQDFLLTASAIGGIIKHRSSISGAEVGCQGEVGSASAMAAAGLCEVRGGTPQQVENAAEIALEHHLGMTCDPVKGLVQVPCIERNAFGAIKAYAAASLAMLGTGQHFMPLDSCIAAMKQTGQEMSVKYKETALGGLAVSITEC